MKNLNLNAATYNQHESVSLKTGHRHAEKGLTKAVRNSSFGVVVAEQSAAPCTIFGTVGKSCTPLVTFDFRADSAGMRVMCRERDPDLGAASRALAEADHSGGAGLPGQHR